MTQPDDTPMDLRSLPNASRPSVPTERDDPAVLDILASDLPARRLTLCLPTSSISFSIPAGVTDEAALADVRRMHLRVAQGHSRSIVCIDGPPGRPRWQVTADGFKRVREPFPVADWSRWAALVARSYVRKWLTIAHRATAGRGMVAARMSELDAAILKATTAAQSSKLEITDVL